MIYCVIKNSDNLVVGKEVSNVDIFNVLAARYPLLTFTVVDKDSFDAAVFTGPSALL